MTGQIYKQRKTGFGGAMFAVALALGAGTLAVSSGAATSVNAQEMTLQATTVLPEADFSSEILKRWMDTVTKDTDGRIKFRAHWSGSLVGPKMIDGMQDGTVDVVLAVSAYASGNIIDLAVLDIPFSLPMSRDALEKFNNEVLPIIDTIYAREGSRAVSAPPMFLPDALICKDRFAGNAAAWDGVRIRSAGRWQAETVKRWGGSPVVLGLADLYTGLDRGTVDCSLMIYNAIGSLKLYEVAPQITRIDHSISFGTINVSNLVWDKLSEADRKVMRDAGLEAMTWGFDLWQRKYHESVEQLPGKGVTFCVPSDAEFDRLVTGADGVIESELKGKTGPEGAKLIAIVEKYRPYARARPRNGDVTVCK